MSWEPEVEEIRRREALAREMGGPERVERQRAAGKLTVRERVDALSDAGTFHEIGALAGVATYESEDLAAFRPANQIIGRARVEGRPVVIAADDFTVRGGAADAAIWQKAVMAEQMAFELRLPLIRMVDGTGGGGSVMSLETMGRTYVPFNPGFDYVIRNLSTVPVVGLALGPVAGLGAARVVASHHSVMVRELAQVFVAGPPLVARLGETVDKEGLGGSHIHGRNGVVDDVVESEAEAFARARAFLSFLPSAAGETPPRGGAPYGGADGAGGHDGGARGAGALSDADSYRAGESQDWLIDAIPRDRRQTYDARRIITTLADRGSFFEIGRGWGRSAITGLARFDGIPVALFAGDPRFYAAGWTAGSSQKVERHLDLAQTFRLPVVHLVDNPGFVIGVAAEKAGTIRHGMRTLAAVYRSTVPWCSVILRKAFGVAGAAHQPHHRFCFRYAWPSGDWGSLPLEGGVEAAYRARIEASEDPAATRAALEAQLEAVRSPFRTAEAFLIEEIIDPRATRDVLLDFVRIVRRDWT